MGILAACSVQLALARLVLNVGAENRGPLLHVGHELGALGLLLLGCLSLEVLHARRKRALQVLPLGLQLALHLLEERDLVGKLALQLGDLV